MENIKFSIIIPVYNVEKYLAQCVDSVLKQTYNNVEILLIDDGSTDTCPKICDDYAQNNTQIKVIHKKNGGLSDARNAGIEASTGEYIMFLDSDDYWDNLEALKNIAEIIMNTECDVVNYGYKEFYEDTKEYKSVLEIGQNIVNVKNRNEMLEQLIENGLFISSACVKAVKASIIKENNLYFVKNVTSEDIEWCARILLSAKSYATYADAFYVYRQREGSITHAIKYANLYMLKNNILKCSELGKQIENEQFKNLYYNYVAYQYITFLHSSLLCEKDKRVKQLVKDMKAYSWLLNYHINGKVRKVYQFNKLFGYNLMYLALKMYLKR